MNARIDWKNGMAFECENRGIKSTIDASVDHGGKNLGPTPKEIVINGMLGCTAMDVVSILSKMRQKIESFHMEAEIQKNQSPPVYFTHAHLKYFLYGEIASDKAIKAVESSLTKYCGVNYMISKVCKIEYSLHVNDKLVQQGETAFIDPMS
ncbi:MAG: OsmC family protein [Bacteriovoracaceae bacterium]|nr:OsmC family protein [Bacteriovoracaceae bacterium]